MLPDVVRALILDEQERQDGRFIEGVDLAAYLSKLEERAEILVDLAPDRCRGFVAFYCNDQSSRVAFITLALVHPDERGRGIAPALFRAVFDIAKGRGFRACRLEVAHHNAGARELWTSIGFRVIEQRVHKDLMEVAL